MPTRNLAPEPIDVSRRFRHTLERKLLDLETNATRDEITARSFTDFDQLRRHRLLVQAQREEAHRVRALLADMRVRT